jgi:hypothetical protein
MSLDVHCPICRGCANAHPEDPKNLRHRACPKHDAEFRAELLREKETQDDLALLAYVRRVNEILRENPEYEQAAAKQISIALEEWLKLREAAKVRRKKEVKDE